MVFRYIRVLRIIKDMNIDIGMAKPTKMAFLNREKTLNNYDQDDPKNDVVY